MRNKYEIRGDVTAIFVQKDGRQVEALIDTDSLSKVDSIPTTWSTLPSNYIFTRVFKGGSNKPRYIYIHRLVTDCPEGMTVDHINRNPLINTKSNLRVITNAQNQQNKGKKKNNTSGITGVYWNSRERKWTAEVMLNYKKHYVGVFSDIKSAKKAIERARNQLHPFSTE